MRFLIVLAMLATVAIAQPLISIRVNVDNADGEVGPPRPPGPGPYPDPELPPPQPYTKQQLKRGVAAPAANGNVVVPAPTNEGNPAATLVNIEVFVDNQRQDGAPGNPGNPDDLPPPQPY